MVTGATQDALLQDARLESVYILASSLAAVTHGVIPSDWTLVEFAAFTMGRAGLGSLVGGENWDTFALQLADADALQTPYQLDFSAFNSDFEGGVAPDLSNVMDEAITLSRFFGVVKNLGEEFGNNVTLDRQTFGEIYSGLTLPTQGRRLTVGLWAAGTANVTLTYSNSIYAPQAVAAAGTAAPEALIAAMGAVSIPLAIGAVVGFAIYEIRQYHKLISEALESERSAPAILADPYEVTELSFWLQSLTLDGDYLGAADALLQVEKSGVVDRNSIQLGINGLPDSVRQSILEQVWLDTNNFGPGDPTSVNDYYQLLLDGRSYSFVEDLAFESEGFRGALEGFLYLDEDTEVGWKSAAVRLRGLSAENAGAILDLWLTSQGSLSGIENPGNIKFFNSLGELLLDSPTVFAADMRAFYERAPDTFERAIDWLDKYKYGTPPGKLYGAMIDALPLAERITLFQDLSEITDSEELALYLGGGKSVFFNATSEASKVEVISYLRRAEGGAALLALARLDQYGDIYPPNLTAEIEIAKGVWVPTTTVSIAGIDAAVVYVEASDGVPAGYYSVGLVEQDGLQFFNLIDSAGRIVNGYTVTPPIDDPALGSWQVQNRKDGRQLLPFSSALRRIALRTQPLTRLFPGLGGNGGRPGGPLSQLWQDRFIEQRPISTDQSSFANQNGQPLPTLANLGPEGANLQTTQSLAILLGLAPDQVTPDVEQDLMGLDTEAEQEAAFRAMFTAENFDIDALLDDDSSTSPTSVLTNLNYGLLSRNMVDRGFITRDQLRTNLQRFEEASALFYSGDVYGGFVEMSRLVVESNRLKLAAQYQDNQRGTAQEALEQASAILQPYTELSDAERVAVMMYAGLGSQTWRGQPDGGLPFFRALNRAVDYGSTSDRLAMAPFATVLHQALQQLQSTTGTTWDLLNTATGGAYGSSTDQVVLRGLRVGDTDLLALNQLRAGDAWVGQHRFTSGAAASLAESWSQCDVVIQVDSQYAAIISPISFAGQFEREVLLSPGYSLVLAEDPYVNDQQQLVIRLTTAPSSSGGATMPSAQTNPASMLFQFLLDNAVPEALPVGADGYYLSNVSAGTLLTNIHRLSEEEGDTYLRDIFTGYVLSLPDEQQQALLEAASSGPEPASPEALEFLRGIIALAQAPGDPPEMPPPEDPHPGVPPRFPLPPPGSPP